MGVYAWTQFPDRNVVNDAAVRVYQENGRPGSGMNHEDTKKNEI
jgi:hypothetical protein